jgi:hypothetical protein
MRELTPRALVSRKGDNSDVIFEVSETTKVCTDPSTGSGQAKQKLYMRQNIVDKIAHHIKVRSIQKRYYLDTAGINKMLFILRGEVFHAAS